MTAPPPSGAAITIPWQHAEHHCFLDTTHSWTNTHKQLDDGKMDGFYETNNEGLVSVQLTAPRSLRIAEDPMG